MRSNARPTPAHAMFAGRGWTPAPFQERAWAAYARGRSGLLNAPTGAGKTLAVWMGLLNEAAGDAAMARAPGLKALWITPLRALASDTRASLQDAADAMGLGWTVELRTGDTSAAIKKRQRERMPDALVTTPESLSLLLSYGGCDRMFAGTRLCVVDEWHELLGTKRGVQAELALARLRAFAPSLRTWGVSATLANLPGAMAALLGPRDAIDAAGELVRAEDTKRIEVHTLLPTDVERFPWAGHLGLRLLPAVLEKIDSAGTTLLFTNTRGQAEIWFQALARARPEWIEPIVNTETGEQMPTGRLAIHHGSLDRELRGVVEGELKAGRVRVVVCTSSLDLGVDFPPVDQVIQIGSPKGVARLLQRAGRSGHQPGRVSSIVCVPTHALELIEFDAARGAMMDRDVEGREPLTMCLDVLCQHLLTVACGDGFIEAELCREVRRTHAFRGLSDEQWGWCMDFATRGGAALRNYDRFQRLVQVDGRWRVAGEPLAKVHRLGIGTIDSGSAMIVRTTGGSSLGTIEESFVARMKPGDVFVYAGRRLELVRVREMSAYTRQAKKRSGSVVSWQGSRMALSNELARRVRRTLAGARSGRLESPELRCAEGVLAVQMRWSRLPVGDELLIEHCRTREGWHAFVYPLEGRLVHEGLAALCAARFARAEPRTFSLACNDYGFELLSTTAFAPSAEQWRAALSPDGLTEDLIACVNAGALARRQFREVARVAGLLIPSFPGAQRGSRQTQASSELFFDVFSEFDPKNLLLDQARREVMDRQLELVRLHACLDRLASASVRIVDTPRLTPFAFPLWADRLRESLTSEQWSDRVQRMVASLEQYADGSADVEEPLPGDGLPLQVPRRVSAAITPPSELSGSRGSLADIDAQLSAERRVERSARLRSRRGRGGGGGRGSGGGSK